MKQPIDPLQTIERLSAGLKPVRRLRPVGVRIAIWALSLTAVLILELALTGSVRPGAFAELLESGRFLLETGLMFLSSLLAGIGAFLLSVPGLKGGRRVFWLGLVALLAAVALFVVGFWHPSIAPTEVGNRPYCALRIPLYGIVPAALLTFLIRGAAPLDWRRISLLVGIASFIPFAAALQLTCMYSPAHNLFSHVLPAILASVLTALLGRRILNPRPNNE